MDNATNKTIAESMPFSNCSDFQLYLMFNARKDFDFDHFNNSEFFNEMNEYTRTISTNNYDCQYYNEQKFNSTFSNKTTKSLKVIHLNISSFELHQHELSAYLNCLKIQFDVILLTETRSINQSITEK